jgi:tRNA pseudouridine38-40 synthase
LSYDGARYAGWQRQVNGLAVQEVVENALSKLLGHPTPVTGASRTDAGVHAIGQTIHFDTASGIPESKLPLALNTMLPKDIRATHAQAAANDFHARFCARQKIYRYWYHNDRIAPALERGLRWHVPVPLDDRLMNLAASAMIGTRDFAAFAAAGSNAKTTVRSMAAVSVERNDSDPALITLMIRGDGFLYNMVRILAGTLADIGMCKLDAGAVNRAVTTRDRLTLGQTAPAHGLTLTRVIYDGDEG